MRLNMRFLFVVMVALLSFACLHGQQTPPQGSGLAKFRATVADSVAPSPEVMPLYDGPIPNAKAVADEEALIRPGIVEKVSKPTLKVFLPAKSKANGSGVIIFPGGGYTSLWTGDQGDKVAEEFQDHGYGAFVVKYRLPSDRTMEDKSVGPLQDAEQSILLVRRHAAEWKINTAKIGVIGFSAGGHLASTLGTHFSKSYIANPDRVSLRPDFMILVYPVISMDSKIAEMGSRKALLGEHPDPANVQLFSNETQVTDETPPTLILHAADDHLVDVDNSILFFEALRRHEVPVKMVIFERGDHGLFPLPRDDWQAIIFKWLDDNHWSR